MNGIWAAFSCYTLALAKNSYKKCARLTMMKLTAAAKGEATLIQIMCRHGADPNYKVTLKTFSEDQDKQITN